MTQLIIYTILVPLLTAVLSILFRKTRFRDHVALSGSVAYLTVVVAFTSKVISDGAVSYQAGGWPAPYGITLVADHLSVLMLLLTAVVSLAASLYSWGYISSNGKESGYYGFLNFMITGMSGAFVTGDLFNLFVMFELVLMSSYALVAYSGSKESLFISMKYVVLNLIGSSLMLVAIGGLYSITGTLNMADMALVLSEGSVNMAPVLGFSTLLFCVFAIKSGLVPFHFWAPPVYSNSPAPASALMAGVSKKVGIYAVARLYLTVFSQAKMPESAFLLANQPVNIFTGYLAMSMAVLTILLGGIAALNSKRLDKMLSYSSVGQVGFIYISLSIAIIKGSETALVAALMYVIAHGLAKPALFMLTGIIERATGTLRLEKLGGMSEKSFLLSASFFITGFSLVGIPPLIGFFAKFLVFKSVIDVGSLLLIAVVFTGSLAGLMYVSRAWLQVFFGQPVEFDLSKVSRKEILSVVFLATLVLVVGLGLEPVYQLVEKSAEATLNTELYVDTVLGDTR